jgi:hypothetical protein
VSETTSAFLTSRRANANGCSWNSPGLSHLGGKVYDGRSNSFVFNFLAVQLVGLVAKGEKF